jgi:hypothetical protein
VADLIEAPNPRPVVAAMHPLAAARQERLARQEIDPEPVPARSVLGVDRHPAGIMSGTPSGSVGPVVDLDDFDGFIEEQLPLDPFDEDPSA